jgi:hypothetical protein
MALFLPVLGGAYDDGCIITITPIDDPEPCALDCVLAVDDEGNELCECAEPEPCLVEGDILFAPGDVVSEDECETCRCRADGQVVCEIRPDCGGETCEFNGDIYHVGDSFPAGDGCNECFCDEGGLVACTAMACCQGPDDPNCGGPGICEYNGEIFYEGEVFDADDGCNSCECWDGFVMCTEMACPVLCEDGEHHPGDQWTDDDGCNECFCDENGNVACTDRACPALCEYNGELYEPGESFEADDGCNTCFCGEDGNVACTEMACACDPATDPDCGGQVVCALYCEYGFKTDAAGNEFCECRETDQCIEIYAGPHADPNTGECTDFNSVCDIPNGWEPCVD